MTQTTSENLWIRNWFHIVTHLVVLVGAATSNNPRLCHFKSVWNEI